MASSSVEKDHCDDILVNITEDKIKDFINQMRNTLNVTSSLEIDLSKPLRSQHFSVIENILKNPLQEFVSTSNPTIDINSETNNPSYLHLFDGRIQIYNQDGVQWRSNHKMSVKLVIFNKYTGNYKLKNNKNDEGETIMRRQTWQGKQITHGNSSYEWRKHEYKLIEKEQFLKPEPDGSLQVNNVQALQSFPVLVHYFRIKTETKGNSDTKKRKLAKSYTDKFSEDLNQYLNYNEVLPQNNIHCNNKKRIESKNNNFALSNDFSFNTDNLLDVFPHNIFQNVCSSIPISIPDGTDINIQGTIKTYAPDNGPVREYTKVILHVTGFDLEPGKKRNTYSCQFSNQEIPAIEITKGVLEFHAPPQSSPGLLYFWVICKSSNGEAQFSSSVPFYYLPVDETALVALHLTQNFTETQKSTIVQKFKYTAKDLDLSYSNLKSIDFLGGLNNLQGLMLDNNLLTSSTQYPFLPKLRSFSINNNLIDNLEEFIDNIVTKFPSLRCLSMINNIACPYFNQMAHRYYNYKIYVISRIPLLTHLDGAILSEEDKTHAQSIKT